MDKKRLINKPDSTLTTHLAPVRRTLRGGNFLRTMLSVFTLIGIVALSACSSTAKIPVATTAPLAASMPTSVPTSLPQDTATPTQAPAPTATTVPQAAAANTSLDPCQLITSQEASDLASTTFGQGVESTTPEGLKICTYGGNTMNVFTVSAIQAPDLATAQANKDQFLADLQAQLQQLASQGLNVTQLPDFADGALVATANIDAGGVSISGSAFAFLKGTIFVGFSDLAVGGTAPASTAMQTEATAVLGKLQ